MNTKPRKPQYTGWALDESARSCLLELIPPAYPDVIAHHVTDTPPPKMRPDTPAPESAEIMVVGIADDGKGVQALVVTVDGQTHSPDGRRYHCTWSIDRSAGRKPVDSNKVIETLGFNAIDPIVFAAEPKVFF